jgi:S1-C subfamily serine protease
VSLGDSSKVAVGDAVVAIGNALGRGGTPQATAGSVTALNQQITAGDSTATAETLNGTIQIDAFIQPGDSGGPLVDSNGKVIGIDTAAQSSGRFGQDGSNIGFAIPINNAMTIARQIEAGHGSSTVQIGTRGVLGVEVATDQTGSGAVVNAVQSGSPAAGAGIAAGDVITSINGQSVSGPSGLQSDLTGKHPGDSVGVGWTDAAGGHHTATVQLGAGPPA